MSSRRQQSAEPNAVFLSPRKTREVLGELAQVQAAASKSALLRGVANHQAGSSPCSIGERVAAALCGMSGAELQAVASKLGDDPAVEMFNAIDGACTILRSRLEMAEAARARIMLMAGVESDKTPKASKAGGKSRPSPGPRRRPKARATA